MILLACPSCGRQYDVSHLQPGDRVRCICDESCTVSRTPELSVEALVCTHCGGAVGPEDAGCPYCGAALSEGDRRASMLCPGCLARIDAESQHCRACGVAIEPPALTPIPDGRVCPRCEGELGIRNLGRMSVIDCARCGGLWLTARSFEDLCRRAGEQENVLPTMATEEKGERRRMEDVRYIPCLTCGQLMNRRQFRYRDAPSTVVIDLCRDHGVWLDHSELQGIVAFIRSGAFRGRRPEESVSRRGAVATPMTLTPAGSRDSQGNLVVSALEYLAWILFGR